MKRRDIVKAAGAAGLAATLPAPAGMLGASAAEVFDTAPAHRALERLLPRHAAQFRLLPLHGLNGADGFRVGGRAGEIILQGNSPATLLTAAHWYLKYGANAHLSWAGSQVERLPPVLPAPAPLARSTALPHRYVCNDTDDAYSGPYRDFADWERLIDIVALHGFNEMLVTVGHEAVPYHLLQQFGYSEQEARAFIPGRAHQPWWWMQNMSGFGGPVSPGDLQQRAALGRRIIARLRELGITPVFPGFLGTVPEDFAQRNPGARTLPQGEWCGFRRPAWLDPASPIFAHAAAVFYREQQRLFGSTTLFKMDPLQEGGSTEGLDLPAACRALQAAMLRAQPAATWVLLGWQRNPRRELLSAVDRTRLLIVDGLSDRFLEARVREDDWLNTPYAFGSIPNFGGHTTLGARTQLWTERFFAARGRAGGAMAGIAYLPEAVYRDAAACELFSELPWHTAAPDLERWFAGYARFRYGGKDAHATMAWHHLSQTAYRLGDDDRSAPSDSLLAARPRLDAQTAETWAPPSPGYSTRGFAQALPSLLAAAPEARKSDAYRYDVVDIARQAIANHARDILPALRSAWLLRDRQRLDRLADFWLGLMDMAERLLRTHRAFMLGPWLEQAGAAAANDTERERLVYDALSVLTTWGPRSSDAGGLHDYANREWAGMMGGLYRSRWQHYFQVLKEALAKGAEPESIDWFALEDAWTRTTHSLPTDPEGSSHEIASQVAAMLAQPLPG